MAIQKKHGKGRLDKWYKLAKEKGYRARAAFKLIQLNRKYGFLERSKVLIDLCAAPGSWCQVAAESMPAESIIVGVDLAPIKPIPRTVTFQSDITTEQCRATIRSHLKTWKADTVLHDGAPNVGTAWVQDAFSQAELVLQSLKLAVEFLVPGGTFVTKVFRSKDYNSLLWVFNQLFEKVEATKPPSSRNVSAEIFVVCRNFKAPKRIDPRFLDPRAVFAEITNPTPNKEAKVFQPEKKKRQREGYEEGDYIQFKETPASDFILSGDPISILGSMNRLSFELKDPDDVTLEALAKLPETTDEVRNCCSDLKVLGRSDFRLLLRWRMKARAIFGLLEKAEDEPTESTEVAEVSQLDFESQLEQDMQRMMDRDKSRKKKERRKENEKKQKDIVRMQMHMITPLEIGMEQAGPTGDDAMFSLKTSNLKNSVDVSNINTTTSRKAEVSSESESESESDEDGDKLDQQLDMLYEQYQEKKLDSDTKLRAKKNRQENEDGEWLGFSESDQSRDNSSDDESSDSPSGEMEDEDSLDQPLLMVNPSSDYFSQALFKDIDGLDSETDGESEGSSADLEEPGNGFTGSLPTRNSSDIKTTNGAHKGLKEQDEDVDMESADNFETVQMSNEDRLYDLKSSADIDVITSEAMTLARQIASGEKTTRDVLDDGFNKFSFRDRDGLPEWFLDDEDKHSRAHKPISASAAAAIKEKMRAMNARPIKKVREAKDRKKYKAAKRLEKLRQKSALLAEDEGMTESEKAQSITKLMNKAARKTPRQKVKLVVARGPNKGVSGRPRGVKGRYKIVDSRLKKDLRAEKRLAKKKK